MLSRGCVAILAMVVDVMTLPSAGVLMSNCNIWRPMMCDGDVCVQIEPRFGTGMKNRSSLLFWKFSTNFGFGIWQNGHRIWIQCVKTMKINYLFEFFGVRKAKNNFLGDKITVPASGAVLAVVRPRAAAWSGRS